MASSSQQHEDSPEVGLFNITREKDPFWMAPLNITKQTSAWRTYYCNSCRDAGFPQVANHLFLTRSFKPHSPSESAAAYNSILSQQASDEDSRVLILTVSYDHDRDGRLSPETWARTLQVLRQVVDATVSVQLWVDKVDSMNRTGDWGISQLLPYVMFPVVRVGSRTEAGFWSNMEGLGGIFGRGLYHDNSLDPKVIQDYAPIKERDFFISRAATWNAADAIMTFYIHLMFGCLSNYRNHHKEALEKLRQGAQVINSLLAIRENMIEVILGHERNSMYGDGRFEILNGFECRTDLPGWEGLKEWVTLDRFMHPVSGPFRIAGFVIVYSGSNATMAVVHWALSSGWTRRLLVKLTQGSREEGKAIWHLRISGYRQTNEKEMLESEKTGFARAGMPNLYRFDSFNIRWA